MKARILIFMLVLGLGAVAVGWVYESQLRQRVQPGEIAVPDNIDYFLTNLNYRVMTPEGNLDFVFDSRRLEHYSRDDVSRIETPALQIFREAAQWQIDALEGEFEHAANLLHLRREVVMQKTGPDTIELRTESIRFEPERDLISSDVAVVLTSRDTRIEADAAVFDLADRVYRLSNARAVYRNEDS